MHLAATLNHYGLLRVSDHRIVAFEPPVAPGKVEPPFDTDSPVLLRSDIRDGPGSRIADLARRDLQELQEHAQASADEEEMPRPYGACALRLPMLTEWYMQHVLRLPMLNTTAGQSARKRMMEAARQQKRFPRVFILASTYACFLQEGGIGEEAARVQI